MTALGDFSPGDVLTAADLNAIGERQTWTPSYLNFSATTNYAYYTQVHQLIFIDFQCTLTSNVTSTMFIDGFPQAQAGSIRTGFTVSALDGSISYQAYTSVFSGSTAVRFYGSVADKTTNGWNATNPFTWASGDVVRIWGHYRGA